MLIDWEVRKMTTDVLSFDEVVDLIRSRMFDADAIDSSKLHDLKELVSDYAAVIPEGWYQDAFDELQAQGHPSRSVRRYIRQSVRPPVR
jgi:hypothetical protein